MTPPTPEEKKKCCCCCHLVNRDCGHTTCIQICMVNCTGFTTAPLFVRKSEVHATPKTSDLNQIMLDRILEYAYQITKYTILAMLTKKEKEQDGFVEKIMETTKQIEKQYSENWH